MAPDPSPSTCKEPADVDVPGEYGLVLVDHTADPRGWKLEELQMPRPPHGGALVVFLAQQDLPEVLRLFEAWGYEYANLVQLKGRLAGTHVLAVGHAGEDVVGAALKESVSRKVESANDVAASLEKTWRKLGRSDPHVFLMANTLAPRSFDLMGPDIPGVLMRAPPRRKVVKRQQEPPPRRKRRRREPPKPTHEEIWQQLHAIGPAYVKRSSSHKPECNCIMCARKRRSEAAAAPTEV